MKYLEKIYCVILPGLATAGGLAADAAGAEIGAVLGSVVPGLGTLVGGIVGAGVGVVGGSLTPSYFGDYLRYIG